MNSLLPEPFNLFAELADYIPLDTLFGTHFLAGLDFQKNDNDTVTLLWSLHGAEDYVIPAALFRRWHLHANDISRRVDIDWDQQRVVMDETGLPMTRERWMRAAREAITGSCAPSESLDELDSAKPRRLSEFLAPDK